MAGKKEFAVKGQPLSHDYCFRSLTDIMKPAFQNGWVLDALEKPLLETGDVDLNKLPSWDHLTDISSVLVGRFVKQS